MVPELGPYKNLLTIVCILRGSQIRPRPLRCLARDHSGLSPLLWKHHHLSNVKLHTSNINRGSDTCKSVYHCMSLHLLLLLMILDLVNITNFTVKE